MFAIRSHLSCFGIGHVFGPAIVLYLALASHVLGASPQAAADYHERVQPILQKYCWSCHGDGAKEGGHAFDAYESDEALVGDRKLWWATLKNVRSNVMPPPGEERPNADERRQLFDWIEFGPIGIDRKDPDPGRVTLRRLNRVEYHNSVRDLTGVDFDSMNEFPPDDSGYGFDNVGDAMSVSPLLTEKYLYAAREIAAKALSRPEVSIDHLSSDTAASRPLAIKGPVPTDDAKREAYARELLAKFARRAFRRPVDNATVDRLVAIAKGVYSAPEQTFQAGVGAGIAAVVASPRFVFRVEEPLATDAKDSHPLVDEYSLAARLSYFLWSTTPDNELMQLAESGRLRENLQQQIDRMLKDDRSRDLAANFAGQWLRSRDIEHLDVDPVGALGLQGELDRAERAITKLRREREQEKLAQAANGTLPPPGTEPVHDLRWQEREKVRAEYRRLKNVANMFDDTLRRSMREETESYFHYVVSEDRDVLELVDSNYTFVNEPLAKFYGIDGVTGEQMRKVDLPAGSPRGGVITQAALLAVTSNPTRTSPVKRGLYILDNILGYPAPPPPPPNVPQLEMAASEIQGHEPTVRELQELHRRDPLCHTCHARMDPLGLALEHFNALGMWRDTENSQAIDASGTLMTGEKFSGVAELKTIIRTQHRQDFYRCLTEKLLTYALGRGLEDYDEFTVDQIVDRLDDNQGKFSALLMGIIESAPFQRQRRM